MRKPLKVILIFHLPGSPVSRCDPETELIMEDEEIVSRLGSDYSGKINETKTGKSCLNWSSLKEVI